MMNMNKANTLQKQQQNNTVTILTIQYFSMAVNYVKLNRISVISKENNQS